MRRGGGAKETSDSSMAIAAVPETSNRIASEAFRGSTPSSIGMRSTTRSRRLRAKTAISMTRPEAIRNDSHSLWAFQNQNGSEPMAKPMTPPSHRRQRRRIDGANSASPAPTAKAAGKSSWLHQKPTPRTRPANKGTEKPARPSRRSLATSAPPMSRRAATVNSSTPYPPRCDTE